MSLELAIAVPDEGPEITACSPDEHPALEDEPGQRSARATQRISALGEMARGIAHDFRNVLAIIDSGLRQAERNLDNPGTAQRCIDAAHEGIERGSRLAAQLLSFAKPARPDIHAEDANALIESLALFLKYGAGPGIRISFELAENIPICLIDPFQFNAAILNLVINARDAMPEGGEIRISTRRCGAETGFGDEPGASRWLLVRVADSGEGMSQETLERIFDPDFTTKGNSGTGLGLPQVQAFMRSIGGHVRVTSDTGEGTCFDLLFPGSSYADPGPDILWRQIDRWTNEGGSRERLSAASARHERARQFERHPPAGDFQ